MFAIDGPSVSTIPSLSIYRFFLLPRSADRRLTFVVDPRLKPFVEDAWTLVVETPPGAEIPKPLDVLLFDFAVLPNVKFLEEIFTVEESFFEDISFDGLEPNTKGWGVDEVVIDCAPKVNFTDEGSFFISSFEDFAEESVPNVNEEVETSDFSSELCFKEKSK